jgi:hypothetical protein
VATIGPDATVTAAVAEMARHNVGALVVSSDGRTVEGIVSERDVTRALERFGGALLAKPIRLIMSNEVRTATPDEDIESLAVMMTEYRIRHVPVLEDGVLAGIVSIGDVVKSRTSTHGPEKMYETIDQVFDLGCGRLVGRAWASVGVGDIIDRGVPEQVLAFPSFVGSSQPLARRLERWPRTKFGSATDQLLQCKRPRPGSGLEKN